MKIVVKENGYLSDYLYTHLNMPKKRIKQYLTHGSIYVNQQKITQYDYPLVVGMNIILDTNRLGKDLPFDILFEDDYIIVVNKPGGLLTIATSKEKEKTLYHMVREYLLQKNRSSKIFVVHRLDRDTSGIVLFAKNEKMKCQFQEHWNEYVSLREYVAVVEGNLPTSSGRIVQKLKETKTNLVYVTKKEDGKEAITNYEVIKENKKYSLLKIWIETGRKNQIRVAFSSLHHPIVGDLKYGGVRSSRLYLHANRLKLYYPVLKKEILFETANPSEFKKIMSE